MGIGSLMSVKWLLLAMAATTKVQGKTALKRFPLMLIMWLGLLVLGWVALILFRVLRRETQRGLRGIKAAGLFAPVFILSLVPFFQNFQTYIMFNAAYSRGLEVAALLQGRRMLPASS